MKLTKSKLKQLIKEELEKITETEDNHENALKSPRAKEIYRSLSPEDRSAVNQAAQEHIKALINKGYPEWAALHKVKEDVTKALEASKGQVDVFKRQLTSQI